MSIGAFTLGIYSQLFDDGHLSPGDQLMDIGCQVLECKGIEDRVEEFVRKIDSKHQLGKELLIKLSDNGPAGRLWELLGYHYHCLDLQGGYNACQVDLNFDCCPEEFIGQFQLVSNLGTTEHIINQANCFKMIHDMTRTGGIMFHLLPLGLNFSHGFISYTPQFFKELAKINRYRVIDFMFCQTDSRRLPIEKINQLNTGKYFGPNQSTTVSINEGTVFVILHKLHDYPFLFPYDDLGGMDSTDVLNRTVWHASIANVIDRAAANCGIPKTEFLKTLLDSPHKLQLESKKLWDKFPLRLSGNDWYLVEKLPPAAHTLVWPCGSLTRDLIDRSYFENMPVAGLVDANPELWGQNYGGHKIYAPEIINTLEFDTILITSEAFLSEILKEIDERIGLNANAIFSTGLSRRLMQRVSNGQSAV
jgi:hypothetical protein